MKTAVIQLNATDNKEKNLAAAHRLVLKAVKNKSLFVLLPEFFAFRGQKKKIKGRVYESLRGETLGLFTRIANEHNAFILAGSVFEKTKGSQKGFNTSVLINDKGKIAATYRKMNLFEAFVDGKKVSESAFFQPGKKGTVTKVKNFLVGLSVCYDLRFPELYQKYRKKGVDVICVPASFSKKTGQAHWETLLRARAIENMCYVLAPNQTGKDSLGVSSYGNSMIIDPWGKILARASADKEEIIYADIQLKEIEKVKKILPGIRK